MDGPGLLAKTVIEAGGDQTFFSTLQEAPIPRETSARMVKDDYRYELKISPTYMVFDYQNFKGVEIDALRDDKAFSTLVGVITAVRKKFHIGSELRTGLRLFYVKKLTADRKFTTAAFGAAVQKDYVAAVTNHVGQPSDFGLHFDGKNAAGVMYQCRIGPFLGLSEAGRYFEGASATELLNEADFVGDLDQYQENTKFGPDLMWWKPLLVSANNLLRSVESLLQKAAKPPTNA